MVKIGYNLLFFPGSYPFSAAAEDTFVDPEIPFLESVFSRITIIPRSPKGKRKELSPLIQIDSRLGEFLESYDGIIFKNHNQILVYSSYLLYLELVRNYHYAFNKSSLIRIKDYLRVALRTKEWIIRYIEEENLDLSKTIFYTYWLDDLTMGICLAKKKYPQMNIISRTHGGDLFDEQSYPPFIPYRPMFFPYINLVFADSKRGQYYLAKKFPKYQYLFKLARLGVPSQGVCSKASNDNYFRIVSCSYLVPLKRVELLIKGLEILGKTNKDENFEWTHIGDGPLRSELEHIADTSLPSNVKYQFLGFVPEGGVISYYMNNMVDIFINVSSSEGTPVSIMEAQSCGIPVIATDVGGNSEIVTEMNGLILTHDPDPIEIAEKIIQIKNSNLLEEKKKASYENWKFFYNPVKNHPQFIHDMIGAIENCK